MSCLGKKRPEQALEGLLAKPGVSERLAPPALTFQEALAFLNGSEEGIYLLHRFSDPSFIASEAVVCAVAQEPKCRAGTILDVCGGTGHLTRSLRRCSGSRVVLADLEFWKLYLAKRFLVPECDPVCCNANEPLPFRRDQFSLVVCGDAFHYIWSKRQFAGEMQRVVGADGAIILPHLHSALSWNPAQGLPLAPSAYPRLFPGMEARLYDEAQFLRAALESGPVDFSRNPLAAELEATPALVLMASRAGEVFRAYPPPDYAGLERFSLNPLYRRDPSIRSRWRRVFSSRQYEDDYGECKEYLPETLELTVDAERKVADPLAWSLEPRGLRARAGAEDGPGQAR
jgi:SAM-dependent methyltransferase